jgi:cation diffusion facilitator family transporter
MSAELTQQKTAINGKSSSENRQSVLAGWLSLTVNIILFALNLWMATLSGSLALTAETAHNLLDLLASIAVLVGVTLSQRKSRAFPYGLYKVENVVAVVIALGTFFTGYEIARQALFSVDHIPNVLPLMLAGVTLAAVIPVVFSQYEITLGRRINSPSLIADATEFRAHILSSAVVFAALLGQLLGWPLDRPAALIIVVWIAYAGWKTLQDAMRVLLDASLDADTLNLVRQLVTAHPEVAQVKLLTGRNSGRYRFIEMEITLRVDSLKQAHETASDIEAQILAEIPFVERVLVHTEPEKRDFLRIAVPLTADDVSMAESIGSAVRFALCDVQLADGQLLKQEILSNPYASESKGRGMLLAEWFKKQSVNIVATPKSLPASGLLYALQASMIRLEQVDPKPLTDVVQSVIRVVS